MSNPIIISDEEDQHTPLPSRSKKPKTHADLVPTILISDGDPTPQKLLGAVSTPSFVPDTPMSDNVSVCKSSFDPETRVSNPEHDDKLSGKRVISLESDDESENGAGTGNSKKNGAVFTGFSSASTLIAPTSSVGTTNLMTETSSNKPTYWTDDFDQVADEQETDMFSIQEMTNIPKQGIRTKVKNSTGQVMGKKKMTKEERIHAIEEKKRQKEAEKMQKAALKAEAAERKKIEKEKQKWEKGKSALKSIVAEIDTKVVELGSIGGHLLSRLSEKGLTFRITSNPIQGSIIWTMTVPEHISQLFPQGIRIPYILLIYEADEFCNLVRNEIFLDNISRVQSQYPSYTICYLTNRLMAYIHKREKEQYKMPGSSNHWKRPPIEEVFAKLTTHYVSVHSRLCADEAEVAEHVVGLTCSLASCQFRLKALVAIPKVQPRMALAISKKYPTMKSLLSVYMDPNRSVHEKEFLLKDLTTEGLVGGDRRLGEICSKRVYRILVAQNGNIKTDDVEFGADFFKT
ncbi:crossover junction endonuclease EME1B-like isoform X3 [Carica papaya]|uniref:crossover junction endonuclease EME1B-like isoform X3 n=1 Tax=Carica papaya TaxID=3649 RepID=UPI000B8CC731|nr:crossover junction endonuclease EME1B-like isoform X3 [Carica papaya]